MQIENKGKYWKQIEYVHDHQLFIKYQLFMGLIIFSETLHIDTNVKRYKMNDIQPFWRAIHALINCDLDFYLTNQISKASENTYCQLGNNQSIYLKQLSIFITLIVLNVFDPAIWASSQTRKMWYPAVKLIWTAVKLVHSQNCRPQIANK